MRIIGVFLLFISISGQAQWQDYILSIRGDTLNRVDMKGLRQGPWVVHVEEPRGEHGFDEQGYYIDGKKEGPWVRFSLEGDKIAEENYRWGSLNGRCRYYTRNGGLEHEESWRAIDPQKTMDTVDVFDLHDPTKVVDRVVVKLEGQTVKHGEWIYYDPREGTVEKTERYFLDKLQTGAEGDDDLKIMGVSTNKSDTAGKAAIKKPQVILDYEKKNAGKKKVRTRDGATGY